MRRLALTKIACVAVLCLGSSVGMGAPPEHGPWEKYQSDQRVWLAGIGLKSCAAAFESEGISNSSAHWALGFWSGYNTASKSMAGMHTDPAGIMGEIKLECEKSPSSTLINAIITVHKRLSSQ